MTRRSALRWTKAARADVRRIIQYVGIHGGAIVAEQLTDKLLTRVEALAEHPERCRAVPELASHGLPMYRELIVRPYRVLFRIRERHVVVLGVFDGRRDLEALLIERALDP
ncbi:type II toxin-antitoxin system RelE/ParE family toxin [Paraliomyxa miuraensis]|uniref:type II toxin-antitoxin system RelE/ParE family toxin n=1 Tax=Paraliomyxa miuraensis TaxID=376150 RepID=UPI0022500FCF|nr:type II toxin-antitoxin system RelE/ParE family toxin [Paraliomyxa miuraensis]MCX4241699.1 type II toxin-antitoxin system RelE/ParE family toxin [Paraliomyxa miuraensis]